MGPKATPITWYLRKRLLLFVMLAVRRKVRNLEANKSFGLCGERALQEDRCCNGNRRQLSKA